MAPARVDSRWSSRDVNAFGDLVRWGESVGSPFCFPGRIDFRCGSLAYNIRNANHPGVDARRRARGRRDSDVARNSCAGGRQSDPRDQRPGRRERSVQGHPFVPDVANDRASMWRIEDTLSVRTEVRG